MRPCVVLAPSNRESEKVRTWSEGSEPRGRVKARRKRAARVAGHHARRAAGGRRPRQVVQELLVVVAHVGLWRQRRHETA